MLDPPAKCLIFLISIVAKKRMSAFTRRCREGKKLLRAEKGKKKTRANKTYKSFYQFASHVHIDLFVITDPYNELLVSGLFKGANYSRKQMYLQTLIFSALLLTGVNGKR